jgi:hypothetical protein
MTYIELDEAQIGLTRSQVINSIVIVAMALFLMGLGLQSGIRADVPVDWLVTSDDPTFVFQAEDPGAVPFKTLLRVSLVPVGEEATPRNVVDTLTLQRAGRLSTYRVLSIEAATLGESEALEMTYAYVDSDVNPFLSTVPVVVQGRDVVVIRGSQAVVVTFREERSRFEANEILFDNFLDSLEF